MTTIYGNGRPTRKTVGGIGDVYIDQDTGREYKCTFAFKDEADEPVDFEWKEITRYRERVSGCSPVSWNNLKDKPFGEETVEVPVVLEWDGDRTDRYSMLNGMVDGTCQISEKVIGNYQDLIGKKVEYYVEGTLYNIVLEESMYSTNLSISNASGYRFSIPYTVGTTNNCTFYLEFVTEAEDESRKGIYFGFDENWDKTYVTSLELNETVEKEIVKTLDEKYFPIIGTNYDTGEDMNLVEVVRYMWENW